MYEVTERVKIIGANVLAWSGNVAAWQGQLEWFIRVSAGVAALIVSVLTIRSLLRKEKESKKQ